MRFIKLSLIILMIWGSACKVQTYTTVKVDGSQEAAPGLKVSGNKLVDNSGQQIRLRGASFNNFAIFPPTTSMIDFIKQRGGNVVRLPLYVDQDPKSINYDDFKGKIDTLAQYAIAQGMYVILDFHPIADPKNPAFTEAAKRFFADMVPAYGKSGKVFYEIFNEPKDATWDDIKQYAATMIPYIRDLEKQNSVGNPAVIIVGTPDWSSVISAPAQAPLADANVMYTFHFYARQHKYTEELEAIADKIAIFVTEWSPFDPKDIFAPQIDRENLSQLIDWMDRKQISFTCWSFSDEQGMYRWFRTDSLKGQASDDKLEPWGRLAIKRIQAEPELTNDVRSGDKSLNTDATTKLDSELNDFEKELTGQAPTDGGSGSSATKQTDPRCKDHNNDQLTCPALPINPGEEKCLWNQKWQCVDGCAHWVAKC